MESAYWEYMIVISTIDDKTTDFLTKGFEKPIHLKLNDLGREGWEVCSMVEYRDNKWRRRIKYCLKRRLRGG
jgi:hypothetical protein